MKKKFTAVITVTFFAIRFLPAGAQLPVIQWDKTVGGTGADQCMDIIQTADGGYVASGRSTSGIGGDKTETSRGGIDYWLVKLDAAGTAIQWQKRLGTSADDMPAGIIQTPDGGFMVSGQSNGGANGDRTVASYGARDYWVFKLDPTGNPLWQTALGGSSNDMGYCMAPAANGGFIIGGASMSGATGTRSEANRGDYDYWIVRLDSSRNLQWNKAIGGSGWEQQNIVWQTHDGGYILGGASRSGISGDKTGAAMGGQYDYWVVKLDSLRNIQWQRTLGGAGDDYLTGMQQTSDHGYILAGHSNSGVSGDKTEPSKGGFDFWIIRLDSAGNMTWQKTIGGAGDETIYAMTGVRQTADGGYVIAGSSGSGVSGDKTEPSKGGLDYWLVKLDGAGAIQWQKTIGGASDDQVRAFRQTADGGYILGGFSGSPISGDKTEASRGGDDFWIVKLRPPCDNVQTDRTDSMCIGGSYRLPGGTVVAVPGIYADTFRTPAGCDSIVVTTLVHMQDSIWFRARGMLGADTQVCQGTSYRLDATWPGATGYRWNTAATTPYITVTGTGTYWVEVTSGNGCSGTDTVTLTFTPPPVADLGNDTGICDRDAPLWLRSPQPPGTHYLWSNGLSDTQMQVTRSGRYWLQLTRNGCIVSDTVLISVIPTPAVNIGNDSIICAQTPATIGITVSGAAYEWNTGAATPYIQVSATGTYILSVNLGGCVVADTVRITAMPAPGTDLGPDRDICPGQTVVLDATYGDDSRYQWGTGETTPLYTATAAGTYRVQVISVYHCISRDTIILHPYPLPAVSLGEDTTVCAETPLVLMPRLSHTDALQWADSSSGDALRVTHGGQYIVTAINKCGTAADTILVGDIFCDIWLPDAFTPNGDGRNDVFRVLGNTGRIGSFGLSIYNRWGERIFHTGSKYQGWDGRWQGQDAAVGTYMYMMEYSFEGKPYLAKGSFQLIR